MKHVSRETTSLERGTLKGVFHVKQPFSRSEENSVQNACFT
jgi:hypothetical protein